MRLGGVLDREPGTDHRPDRPRGDHRPHRGHHGLNDDTLAVRTADRPGPQRGADHLQPLADQGTHIQFSGDSALHTDDHQPAVGSQRVEIAVQVRRAHDVEDDVGAVAVGRGSNPVDEIFVAMGDHDVGAEFAAQVHFGRRTRRCRDGGSQRARHLDRVAADPTGAAVHQDDLAWP